MNPRLVELFDSIDLARLNQYLAEQREEDLYLEFKQKSATTDGDVSPTDRTGFSKAISAFANADGGVLVFGVGTTHTADHPDRVSGLHPFTSPDRFRVKLSDLIRETTQPPVDDVRIEAIAGSTAGTGFVKIVVPASDRPPHRAMHGDREYYRRTPTGNRKMDHYELEDLFGRRLRPVLQLLVKLTPPEHGNLRENLAFAFLNIGRGVAAHYGFVCEIQVPVRTLYGGLQNATSMNGGRHTVMGYHSTSVVHANGILAELGSVDIERPAADRGTPLLVSARWYAENASTRIASLTIDAGVNWHTIVGTLWSY